MFEGIDRSGKTTQVAKLVEALNAENKPTVGKRFPDRTTATGQVINNYLQSTVDLEDHVIHLLYSANRWEARAEFCSLLEKGTTLIVDRYSFSGVAFSAAKEGMTVEWCYAPERGLPEPDVVIFLDMSTEDAKARGDYGKERYEKEEFQRKVRAVYDELMEDNWVTVNAARDVDTVHKEIKGIVEKTMSRVANEPIKKLWETKK